MDRLATPWMWFLIPKSSRQLQLLHKHAVLLLTPLTLLAPKTTNAVFKRPAQERACVILLPNVLLTPWTSTDSQFGLNWRALLGIRKSTRLWMSSPTRWTPRASSPSTTASMSTKISSLLPRTRLSKLLFFQASPLLSRTQSTMILSLEWLPPSLWLNGLAAPSGTWTATLLTRIMLQEKSSTTTSTAK